jgi:Family of unknown function (DUF5690)
MFDYNSSQIYNPMNRIFQNQIALSIYLSLTAFATYFCVFSLRKPFTAATYEGEYLWGLDYKVILVIAHVLGYATSKGLGIKIISELKAVNRVKLLISFVLFAELMLFFLAIVPPPYNWIFMYLNGVPLGMIYSLVFSYIEGRRTTEWLAAWLCVSFIISSGVVKSVGKWLLDDQHVPEYWMPFATGLIFMPLLLLSVYLLNLSPPPTPEDQAARTPRVPMTSQDRRALFFSLAPGLILMVLVYVGITVLRDIRDNFAVEIFKEVGITHVSVFTQTETIVGMGITILTGLLFLVKNNRVAFWLNYLLIGMGCVLITAFTLLFQHGEVSALTWMIGVGFGVYFGYVPYNNMLFERLLAVTRKKGNVGFLLNIADFIGYLGSVAVVLIKNLNMFRGSWLSFYQTIGLYVPVVLFALLLSAMLYFRKKI